MSIAHAIKEIIYEITYPSVDWATFNSTSLDASLETDLGCDSLDIVEITVGVEEKFNLEIPDEDAEKFKTIRDIASYLEEQL